MKHWTRLLCRLTKQEIIGPNFCDALTVVELTGKDLQPFMVRLGDQELSTDRETKMTPCSLGKAVSKEIPPCNFLFALVSVNPFYTPTGPWHPTGGSPLAVHPAVVSRQSHTWKNRRRLLRHWQKADPDLSAENSKKWWQETSWQASCSSTAGNRIRRISFFARLTALIPANFFTAILTV